MSQRDRIRLNQIAQGLEPIERAAAWIAGVEEADQVALLREVAMMALQAGASEADVDEAVAVGGLRPTYTPVVLVKAGRLKQQIAKVIDLPPDERPKSFRLILGLLAVADGRRRKTRCAGGCSHWWHQDLTNPNVVRELIATAGGATSHGAISQYERARRVIEDAGGGSFDGEKPEALVAKAEAALGVSFPPSYRQFLLELGCGDIGGLEIYGLIDDNFERSSIPNGIWLTLDERRTGLDPRYVLIGALGNGSMYALDMRPIADDGESPVVLLSIDGSHLERVADSFGDYFLTAVREAVSRTKRP